MTERMIALAKRAGAFVKAGARGVANVAVRLKNDSAYRKNACASAAIVAAAAFTVFSIDYLITGGPDWNPGAPRIVPEAHAATVEAPTQVTAMHVQTLDIMAITPLAALEEEVSFATLSADDLLGAPEDVTEPTLQLAAYDVSIKGESAGYMLGETPRPSKTKEPTEL
jgi:hypothetical protein